MKLGINMLLWTTQVGEEHFPLLAELKALGYDGVEFPIFTPDDARYRKVRAELDNLGLECTTVAVVTQEANPISPEASVRRAAVEAIKQAIHTTYLLGGKVLCGPLHSALGHFVGRSRTEDEWKWCVETLQQVGDFAAQADVTLAVEPLNRFECYFLNIAHDARRLVDAVAHPRVRAMYDTFHANIEERSIRDALAALAPVLAHVHISENHRGTPGDGLVRWPETFAALKASSYDGWLTIEAFGRSLPDLAAAICIWRDLFDSEMELARQGLQFMRDHWNSG
ncbi:MAG TPA: sugar phosphate isomerase/epimerase family protein [Chthonomonadaceae bacterium]|nr:sugar phosphate isomerase/epimerase family protein [Chthonomonadaceae bacterium]